MARAAQTTSTPLQLESEAASLLVYRSQPGVERLVGFSTGVFGFAMTLLVGQLALPAMSQEQASTELGQALVGLAPRLLTLVVGFGVAATYWAAYRRVFSYVNRYDNVLAVLNFSLLFLVALQPFATNMLGRYGNTSLAVATYAGVLGLTGVVILLLWWYATSGRRLVSPLLDSRLVHHHMCRAAIAPLVFFASMGIAILNPFAAEASWIAIALATAILAHIFRSKPSIGRPPSAVHN